MPFVGDQAMLATMDSEAAGADAAASTEAAGKQRRPSMTRRSVSLLWLSSKIDKFQSRLWWAGSFLISMRIVQTSTMVFISNAGLQATAACLVALVGVAVQTHAAPYRRSSDNQSGLAATWLLFMWPFVLLVRYSEAVGGEHGVVLGALLIAATVAMVVFVACALVLDVWEDVTAGEAERGASPADMGSERVAEEEDAAQRTTDAAVEITTWPSIHRARAMLARHLLIVAPRYYFSGRRQLSPGMLPCALDRRSHIVRHHPPPLQQRIRRLLNMHTKALAAD
jgi:hypothetical protein